MARPKSDIQPRIVRAARNCFVKDGVDGASLRRIAREAGTNIGMIYYYFPTKDDLFFAVIEEVYAKVLEDFARALEPGPSVERRLRKLFERAGRMSELELRTVHLVAREILVSSSRLDRLVERFLRGHVAQILAVLSDGIADGSLKRELHPAVLMMSTLALGFVPQVVRKTVGQRLPFSDVPQGEQLASLLADILLRGISAPARQ